MISLTRAELVSRFRSWSQTKSGAGGHFTPEREIELVNDGQSEVHALLIATFEEIYFVALEEGIVPVDGEVNLDALAKPFYSLIDFQKWNGSRFDSVEIAGVRRASRPPHMLRERWFVAGRKLKRSNALAITNTSTQGTYQLAYHYAVPRLEQDGQQTEIPPEYAELVPLWAAKLGALQSRRMQDYQALAGECAQREERLRKNAATRLGARQHAIIDVEGDVGFPGVIPGVYVVD